MPTQQPTVPPETEAKFILAQKRFWFAILALAAWLVVLVYVNGASWPEALSDEKTITMIAGIVAMLGLSGVFMSAFKGAKRTVFSRVAEELSRTPPGSGMPENVPEQGRGRTDRGFAVVGVLGWVALALLGLWVALVATGCGSREVRPASGDTVVHRWDPGPPCKLQVLVNGEESYYLEWPRACPLPCPKCPPNQESP